MFESFITTFTTLSVSFAFGSCECRSVGTEAFVNWSGVAFIAWWFRLVRESWIATLTTLSAIDFTWGSCVRRSIGTKAFVRVAFISWWFRLVFESWIATLTTLSTIDLTFGSCVRRSITTKALIDNDVLFSNFAFASRSGFFEVCRYHHNAQHEYRPFNVFNFLGDCHFCLLTFY